MAVERSELQGVMWGLTARLALARGIVAGCIWSVVLPLSLDVPMPETVGFCFMVTIGMPMSYAVLRLLGVLFGWLPGMALALSLVTRLYALAICVADPVIYFLNRRWPAMFGVPHFGLVNFVLFMYVKDPEVMS